MLEELSVRTKEYGTDYQSELERVRAKIDNIDRELLEHMAARMSLVERLAEYKRDHNVSAYQVDRFREILQTRANWGKSMNLYPDLVDELFKLIHMESIRKQTEVMNQPVKATV